MYLVLGVDLIHGLISAGLVADRATLTEGGCHSQHVRRHCLRNVASAAGTGNSLIRIHPALWVGYVIQSDREVELAARGMTESAIAGVGNRSGRTHGREVDIAEVVVTAAESNDDVRVLWAVGCRIGAEMDLVNQQIEIDALRRQQFVTWIGCSAPRCGIRIRRVMTHHAILGVAAQCAVKGKARVALVAVGERDDLPSRSHRGTVHGEVGHGV